jgi:DNA-directed RNA polymerase subunit F
MYGQVHPKCKAHNNRRLPCDKDPMHGQFVCSMHGGKSDYGRLHGEMRQALTMAQKLVAFDDDDEETIEEGLIREVRHSSQIAKAYALAISELKDQQLVQKTPRDGEKMSALVDAWTQERITHARLAKLALDAGIEQRKINLLEQEAEQVVYILVQVLESQELGLSRAQQLTGRTVAAQVMERLPALQEASRKGTTKIVDVTPRRTSRTN